MGLYLLMNRVLQSLPLALKLRWPLVAAASALLAFNVLFGQRIFGAKNWIAIGPITFQPSELVKIVFILAGAATLDRLFAKRNLIFTILFSVSIRICNFSCIVRQFAFNNVFLLKNRKHHFLK